MRTILYHAIENTLTKYRREYSRTHHGKVGFNTVENTKAFLYSDWLYFLWLGINNNNNNAVRSGGVLWQSARKSRLFIIYTSTGIAGKRRSMKHILRDFQAKTDRGAGKVVVEFIFDWISIAF